MKSVLIKLLKTEEGYKTWNNTLESTLSDKYLLNLVKTIFEDCFVYRPEDKPFTLRELRNNGLGAIENEYLDCLRKLTEEDICDFNKALICDFLWCINRDFKAAIEAYNFYEEYVSVSEVFEYNFIAINRMISIYQTTKCKNFDICKMCSLIRRVLSQVKDHGKAYYLIGTCFKNKI